MHRASRGLLAALMLLAVPAVAEEDKPDPKPFNAATPERIEYIRSHFTKYEFRIPMRDGVRLFTSVYVPIDASATKRYPFLMSRTPYSVAPYGLDRYFQHVLGPTEDFEKEGFIFVYQDVRGAHMSEGDYVNVRPIQPNKRGPKDVDESTDTYDTIDWLVKNVAGNNGRAGLWGISYPGFYSSAGAIDSHPALKAVSPQAPIGDWFWDDFHRHGAFNLSMAFLFFDFFGKPRPQPTDNEEFNWYDSGSPDGYQFFLDLGPVSNMDKQHFKGDVAFLKDITSHPNYDAFWQARNILPHLKNIKAAVMTVGGWFDTEDLYGPLHTYAAIEKQNPGITNTLVMGPWQHGGWMATNGSELGDTDFGFKSSVTFQALHLDFFKHHLKGGDAKQRPDVPEAMVFETGANRWRRFDTWPPKAVKDTRLYFQPKGGLTWTPPAKEAQATAFSEYVSDPAKPVPHSMEISMGWNPAYMAEDQRFAARRPDVLVFETPPLDRDITFAGPLEADLWVSTTGTDSDWVVKLIDVNPGKPRGWTKDDTKAGKRNQGGRQMLVRGEPFRGRFRESYSEPKAFKPGEPTKVRFTINDVMHTFQRGHRIMVQVQSTWFPFIDRNPQTFVPSIFEAKETDFVRATQRVYHSAAQPSSLRVQVLPAADDPGDARP